ncbi:MAG: YfiR family protein [Bacteroidales bacterium]|nr:YfiR family protein [Bacteroidales bacterium]
MFMVCFSYYTYSQKFTEYEVKSAYIFNFTKFVQWSESSFNSPNSPYIIGIYKNTSFGLVLKKTIEDRTVHGRKFIIKYINSPESIENCHILFLSRISKSELLMVLEHVNQFDILTVGNNIDNFCESGGIINFTKQYSRYRFEINNDAALKSKISISSKLLVLAKIISEDEIKF